MNPFQMNPLQILDISSGVLARNILEIDLLKFLKYRNEAFVLFIKRLKKSIEAKFYDEIKINNLKLLKI